MFPAGTIVDKVFDLTSCTEGAQPSAAAPHMNVPVSFISGIDFVTCVHRYEILLRHLSVQR